LVSALLSNSCVDDDGDLFKRSQTMRALEPIVSRVARTDSPVLIRGEVGVGKELVARAIHHMSPRAAGPFERLSCASLPEDLLEIALFGAGQDTVEGSTARPGKLELAHHGTLLLDEIGELPVTLQPRLAHVLQEKQVFHADGRELIGVDVRVLAATSSALDSADLWHLLGAVEIVVPPLRERREEIPFLAEHFRSRFAREFNRPEPALSPSLLELFAAYDWPGNVRELENLVKRWVVLGDEAQVRSELGFRMRKKPAPGLGLREIGRRAARAAEQAAIREALERVGGNRAAAARLLSVSYKTLLAKLAEDSQ